MSKAVLSTQALYVTCPLCGEGISAPNGSFIWITDEIRPLMGKKVECDNCGADVTVPKVKRVVLD